MAPDMLEKELAKCLDGPCCFDIQSCEYARKAGLKVMGAQSLHTNVNLSTKKAVNLFAYQRHINRKVLVRLPSRKDMAALLERSPDIPESEVLQANSEAEVVIYFSKDRMASYHLPVALQVRAYLSGYGVTAKNRGDLGLLIDRDQTHSITIAEQLAGQPKSKRYAFGVQALPL
jgi:hypothetical protein